MATGPLVKVGVGMSMETPEVKVAVLRVTMAMKATIMGVRRMLRLACYEFVRVSRVVLWRSRRRRFEGQVS